MIEIGNTQVYGFEPAMHGMRNPMNSNTKNDTFYDWYENDEKVGENDHALAMKLAKAGTTHSKYRRMITVWVDITAPLYWWKEFDTYKVGTVANSCSTMHKIHAKQFTLDDFSHEHLIDETDEVGCVLDWNVCMEGIVERLNWARQRFIKTKDKKYWWQMIQLLPSSYNQRRTVCLNYEVLAAQYRDRKDHKLNEWREYCEWIKKLPYAELITCEEVTE